ncbi:MAG TPA: hypothetical protein VMD05_03665 [Candidatus Nanoarchaeia archaeon]|nr:hypothetical protein [Candidatus Nanoarchaeia archaeon]
MSAETCTIALKNTLNEIHNVCPEIQHSFIFRETGELLAEDDNTTEPAANEAQETFRTLTERATAAGGIESVTVKCADSKVNIARFDDLYVTTVFSNDADEKTVYNLTRVMIPTTLRLVKNIYPTLGNQPRESSDKPAPMVSEPESNTLETQASEFTVEELTGFGGFLNDPETAYVDSALLVQWAETFGNRTIKKITLEAPSTGKSMDCKFRPFKDSKYENKGIVQLPERIQAVLRVTRGTVVLIKPIFEPKTQEQTAMDEDEHDKVDEQPVATSPPDVFNGFEGYTQDAPVSQFMVENLKGIGGFLSSPDGARVDSGIMARWSEMFGDKEIKEITIEETALGKKIQCRFQAIKDSHLEGKGVIQLPDKLQQALGTKKGALVMVKPVVT